MFLDFVQYRQLPGKDPHNERALSPRVVARKFDANVMELSQHFDKSGFIITGETTGVTSNVLVRYAA